MCKYIYLVIFINSCRDDPCDVPAARQYRKYTNQSIDFRFYLPKKDLKFIGLSAVKSFGLMLFFVGSGINAGQSLTGEIYWIGILYGAMISAVSIFGGYLLTHGLFKFSKVESLSIICGGMTSTPAIGALQERDQEVDLSLYSMSYIGALITLIMAVRLLASVFG